MHLRLICIAALSATLLAAACGTMANVRALRTGESALGISYGGPVASLMGMDMPFPYLVARYRYGINDRFGLHAGLHASTLAFGVAGFDAGMSYQLLDQSGAVPGLNVSGGITSFIEAGGPSRVFPNADLTASWLYGGRYLTYTGVQSMYQFSTSPYVVFAPVVGQEVRLGRTFALGLEAKWYAPTEETEPRNVNYKLPIGGKGAVGFTLGANWLFGGWYE